MPRLHLVRHGRAAASWAHHLDPGLDDAGRAQASMVASQLGRDLAPQAIWSSPLSRTQETAAVLATEWSSSVAIVGAFREVPSPSIDPGERTRWLRSALASHWPDLGPVVEGWRLGLVDAVRDATVDAVVFTHFVAINAVVGAAVDDPAVTVFAPGHCSVTVIDVDPTARSYVVVRRGEEATPEVG